MPQTNSTIYMIRLVVEKSIPYLADVAERYAEVRYLSSAKLGAEDLRDADALIVRSITRCDAGLLSGSAVRFIATATAGFDHIDTHYCDEHGIGWSNAPGCNAVAVAQWVSASLARIAVAEGKPLAGRTIGIIGVGHVGSQVARLADALGMKVLLYDPPRAEREGGAIFTDLDTLLAESDIVTLHVPLTREGRHPTYHLADASFVARMRQGAILINACRGAVTDTTALIEAKASGHLSHLMIDCWEGEPRVSPTLLELSTVATPHIAGFSADGKHRGARMALLAVLDHFGVEVDREALLYPGELELPECPTIDLDTFPEGMRLEHALLHSLDLTEVETRLKDAPDTFEALRHGYHYPREMRAYHVVGGAEAEREALRRMDFTLEA